MRRVKHTIAGAGLAMLAALSVVSAPTPAAAATGAAADEDYGRMMLLLDSSGSMKEPAGGGGTKIEAARSALGDVIDGLPDEADVGLRVYGSEVFSRKDKGACTDSKLSVEPGTDNRDELSDAVDAYEPYGETPTGYALQQAAKDLGKDGARSVVLVSDGEATCAPDPCKVARKLHQQGIDLKIDVVGLDVDGKARAQLQCVAASGGGDYVDADSAEEISKGLEQATDRALRPFELEGTPIQGGPAGDPTPIRPGLWTDTLGVGSTETGELVYEYERTMDNSTVHVVANSLNLGVLDSLQVQATTPAGDSCDVEADVGDTTESSLLAPSVTVPTSADDPADPCLTSDRLRFSVKNPTSSNEEEAPISIQVAEEPPVTNADELPEPADDQSGKYHSPEVGGDPVEVRGGASFTNATEIESGRSYRGEIVPGETQVFKIPLDWGQRLNAQVVFPPSSQTVQELTGASGPYGTLSIHDPLRGAVTGDSATGASGMTAATGSTASHMEALTAPVAYKNRGDIEGPWSSLAGYHYVVVAADADDDSYLIPFTLDAEVTGQAAGTPSYADDAGLETGDLPMGEAAQEGSGDGAGNGSGGEASTSESDADEGSATGRIALASGLGVVALALLVGGVVLLRRRA